MNFSTFSLRTPIHFPHFHFQKSGAPPDISLHKTQRKIMLVHEGIWLQIIVLWWNLMDQRPLWITYLHPVQHMDFNTCFFSGWRGCFLFLVCKQLLTVLLTVPQGHICNFSDSRTGYDHSWCGLCICCYTAQVENWKSVISLVHRIKKERKKGKLCANTNTLQEFGRTAQRSKPRKEKEKHILSYQFE